MIFMSKVLIESQGKIFIALSPLTLLFFQQILGCSINQYYCCTYCWWCYCPFKHHSCLRMVCSKTIWKYAFSFQ